MIKRVKKLFLDNLQWREEWDVRGEPADTKFSEEGGRGGASGARAGPK